MNAQHIDREAAGLYALGLLDDAERNGIEAHAAQCDACARALGEAEANVTLLVENEPQYEAPPGLAARLSSRHERGEVRALPERRGSFAWLPVAIAAAFAIGILPSLYFWHENRTMHQTMVAQASAMARLSHEPHRAVPFHGMNGSASASVMYGTDGSWYVVLVADVSHALDVAWMHDGSQTMLGRAVPVGRVAMLYLPKSHRMKHLALMEGNRVVAVADLSF